MDCYQKVDGKENCWASGCHMYMLKHRFTQGEAVEIKRLMLKELDQGLNFKGVDDIIDNLVFPIGRNGVYLLGAVKPGCPHKLSHRPLAILNPDETYYELQGTRDEIIKLYKEEICSPLCYISTKVLKVKPIKVGASRTAPKKKQQYQYPPVCNTGIPQDEWNFNLAMFFEMVEEFKDELSEMAVWKQLCYFLKETNIPTDVLVQKMNKFFKAENPKENWNLIGKNRVTRTTTKDYKKQRGFFCKILQNTVGLELDKETYFQLFFPNKCHTIQDINGLCDRTIVWPTIYAFRNKLRDCFSEIQNYGGTPEVHYKYRDTIGILRNTGRQYRISHTTGKFADKIVYFLKDTEEKTMKLSKIVEDMILHEDLHVYSKTVVVPFLDKNPVKPEILNVYQAPDLVFYKQIRTYNIKKHAIWKYLKTVISWNNSYKLDFVSTYISLKITQPARKVEKILNLVHEVTGCGKTSFFHLLAKLLGQTRTFELTKVDQLSDRFNAHLKGKLLILVDDIHKLSRKQQQNLKTKCTEKHFKLELKGIDSIQEVSYYDTICTSNYKDKIWVDTQDRRTEILQLNPVYKAKDQNFWNEFYQGLENMDLMKGFFDYFANYKIKLNIRNKDTRFDKDILVERASDSLPLSMEFLRTFFERIDPISIRHDIEIFQNGICWVGHNYLYKCFQDWTKAIGSQIKPTQKTFARELKSLGFEPQRRRCIAVGWMSQKRRIELSPKSIHEALSRKFGNIDVQDSAMLSLIKFREEHDEVRGIMLNKKRLDMIFKPEGGKSRDGFLPTEVWMRKLVKDICKNAIK